MAGLRDRRRLPLAIVAVAASALALIVYSTDLLQRSELDLVDARFSVRGEQPPPGDVAVVAIDDVSFDELRTQWPFPRSMHGRLIDRLTDAGVNAIVYDVQFTEPSQPAEDNALINAVDRADVPVILASEEVNRRGGTNIFGGEGVLRQIGARSGNPAFEPDPGGVWRRVPYSVDRLESLAVAAVEERDGRRLDPDDFGEDGAWIDFAGPPETVPTYSFSRVLDDDVDPADLRDRTVVVGASSPTLQDVHPVPTSDQELMAGAEGHANAIATLDQGFPLKEAGWPLGAALIVLLGSVVPAAGARWSPLVAAALGLAAGAIYLVAAQLSFNSGLILPVVYPLLALGLAVVGTLAVHYLLEAFERRRVRDTFARFVPAQVVGQVLKRADEDLRLGGERRECTVLFSDIRGFTTFSESRPPDEVVKILNEYLGAMTDAIMDHGGTLISYMGDGIMAVFGAPLEQSDHAHRALRAAREMLGPRLEEFNRWVVSERLAEEGFRMGVGLNSGTVMTGQVGSDRRVEYTAIGDTTNTAARLEGMTKGTPYSLFVSEYTRDLVDDDEGLEFVDRLEVRGRSKPIGVWGDAQSREGEPEGAADTVGAG